MKISEIPLSKVLAGTNWSISMGDGAEGKDRLVRETDSFGPTDHGLFCAIMKMNDGSEHPAVIVKSFPEGGLHTETFVRTKVGWLDILEEGFMRAIERYPGDVFPYEIYIGRPWTGDKELAKEGASKVQAHMNNFDEAVERLKGLPAKS